MLLYESVVCTLSSGSLYDPRRPDHGSLSFSNMAAEYHGKIVKILNDNLVGHQIELQGKVYWNKPWL